jgi:hypothetical protein
MAGQTQTEHPHSSSLFGGGGLPGFPEVSYWDPCATRAGRRVARDDGAPRLGSGAKFWTWSRPAGRSPRSPRRWGSATSPPMPGAARPHRLRPGARPEQRRAGRARRGQAPHRRTGDRAARHPPRDGATARGAHKAASGRPRWWPLKPSRFRSPARVVGLSTSGSYDWRPRPPSARATRPAWLTSLVVASTSAPAAPTGRGGCMPSCALATRSWSATGRWSR